MTSSSKRSKFIAIGLLVSGLWIMYQFRPAVWVARPWETPMTTVLWLTMLVVATISLVPLPRRRYGLSLVTAVDLGAFLVFGPAVAAWCAVVSRLLAVSAERWNPFLWSLSRIGGVAVAFGAAGWLFEALGGNSASPALATQKDYVAALAAAAVYLVVRLGTWSFFLSMRWGISWKKLWSGEVSIQVLFDLALLPFAALLALTQFHIGSLGVAFFLVPLLLVRYSIKLWMDTREAHLVTVRALMNALDASDPFTRGVSRCVSEMAVKIARRMNLPEKEIEELEYAALLHDLGRIAIHRDVLGKPGELSANEAYYVALAPRYAYEMIQNIGLFQGAAEIVLNHHEQPDGKGYPRGISGNMIPTGSSIIMAVSAFHAMISDRPYRRGLSPREAIDELLVNTGTQFVPEVVEALIALYSQNELLHPEDAGRESVKPVLETFPLMPGKKGPSLSPKILELPQGGTHVALDYKESNGLEVAAFGKSDIGCVRRHNEDSILVRTLEDKSLLLAVADGMGGSKGGAVASSLVIESLKRLEAGGSEDVRLILEEANGAIYERGSMDENLKGMGTTATVVTIGGGKLRLGHVGDSRAYLVNKAGISTLTRDHTLGMELRQSANGLPGIRNVDHVLTRCLGVTSSVQVDPLSEPIALKAGDYVVVCTDGLTGVVSDKEIQESVLGESPGSACGQLIELAKMRGGPDNISVVIGRVA